MRGILLYIVFGLTASSCVEEFSAKTNNLDSILVVNGLLTDQLKRHKVQLTRVFAFEEENPAAETQAIVQVVDNEGLVFPFEETEPGTYFSQSIFAAKQGNSYRLQITTANGNEYASTDVAVPNVVLIGDIRAQRITNDRGEEGVGIFLDNDSDSEESTFFRYEFEETYKIVAPKWDPFRLEVVKNKPCDTLFPFIVDIVPWEDERKTCYGSLKSKRLIQASSVDLEGNAIDNFQLQFISRENYIISHRYSINVTQHAQTQDAHSFYERLGDFSFSDNLFSQVQPGFLEGNIALESNPKELVLGYFELTSVSEKRIYFNYKDLFPGEPLPPYANSCDPSTVRNTPLYPEGYFCLDLFVCGGNCESPLIQAILLDQVVYAETIEDDRGFPFPNSYFTWPAPCGDCTQLGSNVVPDFWVE